jgi:hypothetical protein
LHTNYYNRKEKLCKPDLDFSDSFTKNGGFRHAGSRMSQLKID